MKTISVNICEEYYNPFWFYNVDYDMYQSFANEHRDELIDIIENKKYDQFIKLCNSEGIILPTEFCPVSTEYEVIFEDNPSLVRIYIWSEDEDDPGGGSLELIVYDSN